jgi:hypothetical protein
MATINTIFPAAQNSDHRQVVAHLTAIAMQELRKSGAGFGIGSLSATWFNQDGSLGTPREGHLQVQSIPRRSLTTDRAQNLRRRNRGDGRSLPSYCFG